MVKIKSIYLSAVLLFMIVLASFDVIFMKGTAGYGLIIVYAVILSLAGYAMHDAKVEKKYATGAAFLAISVGLASIAQYVFSFHYIPALWAAFLFLAASLGTSFISAPNLPENGPLKELKFSLWEAALLSAVLALALFLRLYSSGSIPPGIWFDEAQNGNEVIRILSGKPLEIFIPRLTMMPAMFFYIAAFFTKIFGVNIEALRLVSVVTGVMSIAAFYFLCRHIFRDVSLAAAGAFLLATSRWHITFSRVAFLGMLTLLLVITCFYYYLKASSGGKKSHAALSGVSMGLALYTFSGANFIPIIIMAHLLISFLKPKDIMNNRRIKAGVLALCVAAVIAAPLGVYALKNPGIFSKRFRDLSIANDITNEKSLMPVLKSAQIHLLMFNYEGDYNGRHNLYKKPMLDMVTGAFFMAAFFICAASKGNLFYFLWFAIMLSAGMATISIEAPQAYRIIGVLPVIYIFVLLLLKKIKDTLFEFSRSKQAFAVFLCVMTFSAAGLNIYQYFVLYPREKATYMSFSPEANAIAGFIKDNSEDYLVLVTKADNMYGFFPWEQKLISDFVNYKGPFYDYLKKDNTVTGADLGGRKGVILLLRPSDTEMMSQAQKEYPKAQKKEFRNRVTDEIMFVCYYVEKDMIKKKAELLHG